MQRSIGAFTSTARAANVFRGSPSQQRAGLARGGALRCYAGVDPAYGAAERTLLGDNFGARDPTAGEIGSNFAEKTLGNYDTEHIIKPPEAMGDIVGLKNKKCVPCKGDKVALLGESEVNRLGKQCPGWRVERTAAGVQCLSCEWKVRNFAAGLDLMRRIGEVAEGEGHHPDLHLTNYNRVEAEVTTHAAGGLTENDFILAAKVNELDVADLLPKRKAKFWA